MRHGSSFHESVGSCHYNDRDHPLPQYQNTVFVCDHGNRVCQVNVAWGWSGGRKQGSDSCYENDEPADLEVSLTLTALCQNHGDRGN